MIENFLTGTATLSEPLTIGVFIFGVLGGMLFGAIPGVSMLTLLRFFALTADLSPAQGVMSLQLFVPAPMVVRLRQFCSIFPVPENAPTASADIQ